MTNLSLSCAWKNLIPNAHQLNQMAFYRWWLVSSTVKFSDECGLWWSSQSSSLSKLFADIPFWDTFYELEHEGSWNWATPLVGLGSYRIPHFQRRLGSSLWTTRLRFQLFPFKFSMLLRFSLLQNFFFWKNNMRNWELKLFIYIINIIYSQSKK